MRRRVTILLAAGAVALAGCGGGDAGDGGITGSAPTGSGTTGAPASESAITSSALRSCLQRARLKLVPSGQSYTDASGTVNSYGSVDVAGSHYAGEAVWPSGDHAGVYIATDEASANDGEQQLRQFVQAFGGNPADFVQRQGNVLVLLDDSDQPTPAEAKILNDCATGTV
jgi:hypothetical protein